jgi:ABC-type bacteriocin/lantibiotic exporter with double-glycine peptidase domain
LDEGTANLDPATEEAIAEVIAGLPVTRIVVAHRPALSARAHRILRVSNASMVECERPSQLGVRSSMFREFPGKVQLESSGTSRPRVDAHPVSV